LRARLLELAGQPPARRWQTFEALVADLFKRAHFRIERESRAAGPRQLDLAASRRGAVYLVEAKWKSRPLTTGDVDGLYARLAGTAPQTVGVMISPSGFTKGVREEVARRKDRPVLLVGPRELVESLDDPRSVAQMLQRKLDHLNVTGEVLVGPNETIRTSTTQSTWGLRQPFAVDADGSRLPWVTSGGGYGQFVFAVELADVDWVPSGGRGVCLDLEPAADSEHALIEFVEELAAHGYVSVGATWVIEQFDTAWHGFGWTPFIDAVAAWRLRYEAVGHVHHTEQFCLADSLDGRLLVLSGDVSADDQRVCRSINLSFHLQGIPLDPAEFIHLAEVAGDFAPTHWRPLSGRSVETAGLLRPDRRERLDVEPVAFVVEEDPHDSRDRVWVRGLVITNPFPDRRPRGVDPLEWPAGIGESELVVCSLGQWHPWGDVPDRYELRAAEWANTTEFSVVRVTADWRGELTRRGESAHSPAQPENQLRSRG
jgi:Restriction endonuclease